MKSKNIPKTVITLYLQYYSAPDLNFQFDDVSFDIFRRLGDSFEFDGVSELTLFLLLE